MIDALIALGFMFGFTVTADVGLLIALSALNWV